MPNTIKRNTGKFFSDTKNTAWYECPNCEELQMVLNAKDTDKFQCDECSYNARIED